MSGLRKYTGQLTVGKVFSVAALLIAAGFLYAAGGDLYSRLFKRPEA